MVTPSAGWQRSGITDPGDSPSLSRGTVHVTGGDSQRGNLRAVLAQSRVQVMKVVDLIALERVHLVSLIRAKNHSE